MPQSKRLSRSLPGHGKPAGQTLGRKLLNFFIDPAGLSDDSPSSMYASGESSAGTINLPPRFDVDGVPFGIIVIDVSGSMACGDWLPSRLEAAKTAAKAYVKRLKQLSPDAMVAVITFGCKAKTACGLTSVKHAPRILNVIDLIEIEGSTNLTAGLNLTSKLLTRRRLRAGQVILLTDGHSTVTAEPDEDAKLIRQAATLETIGIGGKPSDVDEKLLRRISSKHPDGSPCYHWIGDKGQLVEHFQELAGRITR